jgi:hypothetical protein
MGYANPLLKLPAAQKLLALPPEQREAIEALMRELRADADKLAEQSWKKRKGPMAAYWRAVATYARHTAHALSKAAQVRMCGNSVSPVVACALVAANYCEAEEQRRAA